MTAAAQGAANGDKDGDVPPSLLVRVADGLMIVTNVMATAWILLLMVLILADVAGRNLFLAPIAGVPEMVKYSIVGIVFLQIAHTHRCGEMVRSNGVMLMIGESFPRISILMDMFAQLCGMAFSLSLAWAIWPKLARSWQRGEMEGVSGHFQIAVWPFLLIITVGAVLLAVSFALSAVLAARRLRGGQ
ncbi:TRAP transporter small permease subunit [Thalassospira marina]|uniref:TRAP transporter small permease protein n=1 Tax=Thalassospira marina TaxID=2048283 RepID=A0A2N3KTC8_9PROT|nr:TRAP transporter small permease subunit [Thalassospira marina]AUG55824.1 hypothetical protein CSC3H3_23615 [Thalassospira marina]PKR53777.1 hypothetical protein COO20_12220 [Thalassospira marina]